jgi:sulfide:quinone oxidoreductase
MIASHKVEITVVSDRQDFSFTPSNPWVSTRKRTPSEISLPLKKILPRYGIQFINGKAPKLNPESKVLRLEDGKDLPYDYLIIATGPRLGVDEIPGLSKASNAHSVCTTPHASKTADALDELVKNPQPVVVGATQGASCFGPAYEFALLLQDELNKRGGKKLVEQCSPISFVTPEPYIGHLGLGGAGKSADILTKLLKKKKIDAFANSRIREVKRDAVNIEQLDEDGKVVGKHRLPSALTMLIPPFRGQQVWKTVKGLTNDKGMIIVNEFQQSPAYPDIFAVGACVEIPSTEESVIPIGFPKTGYMIESMGTATVSWSW